MNSVEIENIEIDALLTAIAARYGYDFRHYARASLRRRLEHRIRSVGVTHISELLPKVLHDPDYFDLFLANMTITTTDIFRDPDFFKAFREQIIPVLKSYPFIKIWHAGCSTGEEVYSVAIILQEEGLYHRAQIYATDINSQSLAQAKDGIFRLDRTQNYTANYMKAGGKASFSDYYHAKYDSIKMNENLKENITFAHHNLTSDGVFGEMNVVLCRNVLIYFDSDLQNHVLRLLDESLCRNGFLCLGTRESIDFSDVRDDFRPIERKLRMFQKSGEKSTARVREGVSQ